MGWNLNTEEGRAAKKLYEANYREKNKERINQNKKRYRDNNKETIRKIDKKYREENKDKINAYRRERIKTDSLYRITSNIRSLIRQSFRYKGLKKNTLSEQILGCSFEEFKNHLESKFEPWMTWDNYGLYKPNELKYGWDIDHIIPINSATTEEEVICLNHYTNLQPLCSYTNRNIKMDDF